MVSGVVARVGYVPPLVISPQPQSHWRATNAYGLDGGDYYVAASSGCDWSFTLAQR
jgi:hypothetical protein